MAQRIDRRDFPSEDLGVGGSSPCLCMDYVPQTISLSPL